MCCFSTVLVKVCAKFKFQNLKVVLALTEAANTCVRVSFLTELQALACNFIEKETLTQVFSCEFCEISNNTFFIEHLQATASALKVNKLHQKDLQWLCYL